MLEPTAREILGDIWHVTPASHAKRVQKVERQSGKRAIEVARYVLPVAAFTTMVHTLSGIVLHRLWRMSAANDTPTEARLVIGEMVARVREVDAQFFDRFDNEPMEALPEFASEAPGDGEAFAREFDARLDGLTSRLIDSSPRAIAAMAEAYRAVMGLTAAECPDAEALARMLDPARNPYRRETLNVGVHAPMMRPLDHAHFTFAKKISHTADSQDQRHRMVPGSRPLLTLADTRSADYVTPMLVRENPRALEIYQQAMEEAWAAKNELLDRGVARDSRSTCCRMRRRFGSSNRDRCCICCTSGRCGRASTRRKRFIRRRSKRRGRCARLFPSWGAISGRRAICAREFRRRFVPRARTSAA